MFCAQLECNPCGSEPTRSCVSCQEACRHPTQAHQGPAPAFFVQQAHEVRVGDALDTDWALASDWPEERRLRELRNHNIEKMMKKGKAVPTGRRGGAYTHGSAVVTSSAFCQFASRSISRRATSSFARSRSPGSITPA